MTATSKVDREFEVRLKPYAKRDSFYSIVLSLTGFAAITLILLGDPYIAVAVIITTAVVVTQQMMRKRKVVARDTS
jgi:hypothetical protein